MKFEMNNISIYIRSKFPVGFNRFDNETVPLTSSNKISKCDTNHDDIFNNVTVDGYLNLDGNKIDCNSSYGNLNDNNTFSTNNISNENRINEWQAAWNITNAIQVIFHCNYHLNSDF